jgi:hypothetical protein
MQKNNNVTHNIIDLMPSQTTFLYINASSYPSIIPDKLCSTIILSIACISAKLSQLIVEAGGYP